MSEGLIEGHRVETADEARARKRRSVAIAVALVAMVGLFYVGTLVKLGPEGVRNKDGFKNPNAVKKALEMIGARPATPAATTTQPKPAGPTATPKAKPSDAAGPASPSGLAPATAQPGAN
ncbi:MAG: hypothetical protein AAFR04_15625 [Pseudomonadota bacterium]